MIRVLLDGHSRVPDTEAPMKVIVSVPHFLSGLEKAGPRPLRDWCSLHHGMGGSEGEREDHTLEHLRIPGCLSFQVNVPSPWKHGRVLGTQHNSVKGVPRQLRAHLVLDAGTC